MMRGKAFQAGTHAVHGRLEICSVQISRRDREMIAVMEFFFAQQTALKPIDQRKNFGVSHFCCSKEKRPPVIRTGGRDLCSFPE
jgi:hypothetical protein